MTKESKKGFAPKAEIDTGPGRRTLTLKLGENGEPLWDKFTEPTLAAWKKVLSHPATEKVLPRATAESSGEGSVSTPSEPPPVSPELVSDGLDILGRIEGLIFARLYRLPQAAAVFAFTEKEKAKLIPPAQRLIAKYSPLTQKYGDEITLALVMVNLTAQKVYLCRQLAAAQQQAEKKAKQEAAQEPQPAEPGIGWTEEAAVTQ